MSLVALAVAALIGITAGVLCVRFRASEKFIMSFFQILRVVPSLAILFLLVPILGTGFGPALVALVILGIPPIIINTVTGLEEVPDFMLETASGCGMTTRQSWLAVRIPLAMPLILTGIKTSLIEIIASATLAAKIGGGGLGEIIFTGIGLSRTDLILVGGLSVAVLSIGAGLLFNLWDRLLLRYKYV